MIRRVSVGAFLCSVVLLSNSSISLGFDRLDFADSSARYLYRSLDVQSDFVYATTEDGIEVIDVSNPADPRRASQIFLNAGSLFGITAHGNLLLVCGAISTGDPAKSEGRLFILDIANPAIPRLMGEIKVNGGPNCVEVSGSHAYVGSTEGLSTFDISNPALPKLVALDTLGSISKIQIRGSLAFILISPIFPSSLAIIDISAPETPTVISRYETPWMVWDLSVVDSLVYLTDIFPIFPFLAPSAILILNVADPTIPKLISTYQEYKTYTSIDVRNDTAFVDMLPSIMALDVNDPDNITFIATYTYPGINFDMHLAGDYVHIASYHPVTNEMSWLLECDSCVCGDNFAGNSIVVKPGDYQIVDISDPSDFCVRGIIPLSGVITDVNSIDAPLPQTFTLRDPYPNPFNPTSIITFTMPAQGIVKVEVFNLVGQRITTLFDGKAPAGETQVEWNAQSLPSGVYFIRASSSGISKTVKALLLK